SLSVPDDRACNASTSISCGAFPNQACTGAADQAPLGCPSTCGSDVDCAASAYCNGNTCTPRLLDGGGCGGDRECQLGHHCLNSHCCNSATGACCQVPADCPASYASAAVCDLPAVSCQGHRTDRSCVNNLCGSTPAADDSACGAGITRSCGAYLPVQCSGTVNQAGLQCATSCVSDAGCVQPANHCESGTCRPWVQNGATCSVSADCLSGQ